MADKKESMGEFWDRWEEELEEDKAEVQRRIAQRKADAKKEAGEYDNKGKNKVV